jgi:hypothetical protein
MCKEDYETGSDNKTCTAVVKHDNGCTTASSCVQCAYGYYVNSASTVTPMTCAKSTRYGSVAILSGAILSWFAFMKF